MGRVSMFAPAIIREVVTYALFSHGGAMDEYGVTP